MSKGKPTGASQCLRIVWGQCSGIAGTMLDPHRALVKSWLFHFQSCSCTWANGDRQPKCYGPCPHLGSRMKLLAPAVGLAHPSTIVISGINQQMQKLSL